MTNKEAIEKFKKIKRGNIFLIHQRIEGKEVIEDYSLCDMAISALQAQTDGDCISRQDALDAIGKCTDIYVNNLPTMVDKAEAYQALNEVPSAQPEPHWIPVEERLPKQDEMVLITIIRKDERYNKTPFISIGYISWNNTVWWCAHDGDCKSANVEVLAWKPLPEPYREESEEV